MQVAIGTSAYGKNNPQALADFVRRAEQLGVAYAWSAEAWGSDAIVPLAYLAAITERIKLGTGVIQVGTRTPAKIAMTALTMAAYTNDRFALGLGVSGPQVIEGLHGIDYRHPLARLRETIEIVRMAMRGDRVQFEGRFNHLPRPGGQGKALRLDHDFNVHIPIFLATIAPRALELTGELADGWLGTSFSPNHAEAHFEHLRTGAKSAGRTLQDMTLQAACSVAIGDNVEELIAGRKPGIAFSLGAMGSSSTNFYNDAYCRAGFSDDAKAVQLLWLDGKRDQAIARVPDAMVEQFSAIGTPDMVRDRLRLYDQVGINCLQARLDSVAPDQRIEQLEQLMEIVAQI